MDKSQRVGPRFPFSVGDALGLKAKTPDQSLSGHFSLLLALARMNRERIPTPSKRNAR